MNGNKITQSSLQSSTLLEIGNAIRNSELSEVEESVDLIIQHLLDINKENSHAFTVFGIMAVVKELTRRLSCSSTPSPRSLPNLVSAILSLHSHPSLSSQAVVMNSLSSLICVYPYCLKSFQQPVLEWVKSGLYSHNTHLVKESAILIVLLHSCNKKPEELSEFFVSCLQLLKFLLQLLNGEESTVAMSAFHLTPCLSLEGRDRLQAIVRAICSISRVIGYCLAIDTTTKYIGVSIAQLMEVILFALEGKWGFYCLSDSLACTIISVIVSVKDELISPSLKDTVHQATWQLLLVVIQQCRLHLLCYSEFIEAIMVAALQENKSPLITSLVCRCIEKWLAVRGQCQLFVEDVVLNLCLIGHRCVQKLNSYAANKPLQLVHEGSEVWLLFHCLSTLCVCVSNSCHLLPSTLLKGLRLLEHQMPSSLPPQVTAKGKEIRAMMKGTHVDLDPIIEFAANNLDTPTIPDQLPPIEESTDIFPSLGHAPKTSADTPTTGKPTKRSLPNSPPVVLSEKQPSSLTVQSQLETNDTPHKKLAIDSYDRKECDGRREREEPMCVEESVGTEEDLLMEIFTD